MRPFTERCDSGAGSITSLAFTSGKGWGAFPRIWSRFYAWRPISFSIWMAPPPTPPYPRPWNRPVGWVTAAWPGW